MPTYVYYCPNCDCDFEREQKISEKPNPECKVCGGKKAVRQISKTSFALKGKGWFKDGY